MEKRIHVLSFDLEEWFYIYSYQKDFEASVYWENGEKRASTIIYRILDILKRHGATATFFCMGEFARKHPDIINHIAQSGHEIAAHSDKHIYACNQTLEDFESDLKRNIDCLKEITGKDILSYRTPAYSLDTLQAPYVAILSRLGIKYNSSMKSNGQSAWGWVPNAPFVLDAQQTHWALPVSTYSFLRWWPYGGSGFFRVSPFFFTKCALRKSGYHMLYFHPRDFDEAMWRLPSRYLDCWKYGIGTRSMFDRLDYLLQQYRMYSIEQALQLPAFHALSIKKVYDV